MSTQKQFGLALSSCIKVRLVSETCTARTVRAVACVRCVPCSLAASGHVTAEAFPPVSGRHLLLSRRTRCSLSACASSSWKAAAIWNSTKIQLLACLWMYSYILFLCQTYIALCKATHTAEMIAFNNWNTVKYLLRMITPVRKMMELKRRTKLQPANTNTSEARQIHWSHKAENYRSRLST